MLETKLQQFADKVDIDGFESLLELQPETHLDLETLLNGEIDTATDEELKKYLQLRFLFRILFKYSRDMKQGLNQLIKYESNG